MLSLARARRAFPECLYTDSRIDSPKNPPRLIFKKQKTWARYELCSRPTHLRRYWNRISTPFTKAKDPLEHALERRKTILELPFPRTGILSLKRKRTTSRSDTVPLGKTRKLNRCISINVSEFLHRIRSISGSW